VFSKKVPKTSENFRAICSGDHKSELNYKGTIFSKVVKESVAQGGKMSYDLFDDLIPQKCIYGEKFEDEKIWFPHSHKGVLTTANTGPDSNDSQFFICLASAHNLNETNTVFGRVISGFDFVERIEDNPTGEGNVPVKDVTITNCGELKGEEKLSSSKADFLV